MTGLRPFDPFWQSARFGWTGLAALAWYVLRLLGGLVFAFGFGLAWLGESVVAVGHKIVMLALRFMGWTLEKPE